MLISMLKNCQILQTAVTDKSYFKEDIEKAKKIKQKLKLSQDKWCCLAEAEAVLNIMHTLAMEIQKDRPSRISVCRLDITMTQHKIKTMKKLEVIDVLS